MAAIAAVILVAVVGALLGGTAVVTSTPGFCGGLCHAMDEQYTAWKDSKHFAVEDDESNQATCVDCHFLPGGKMTVKGVLNGLRHAVAYLYDPDAPLPIRPIVRDGSCLRSGCHVKEKFQDKEIVLSGQKKDKEDSQKIIFKHKAHFETGEKEPLKGQKLACETCHVKVSAKKHFEVPRDICFVCHLQPMKPEAKPNAGFIRANFPRVNFNDDTSKCVSCHKLPTKSLQRQKQEGGDGKDKPITHQTLEEAKVPCESCHLHMVKGASEIKIDECLDCHSATDDLYEKGKDSKLMHDKHVATFRADCLDCHRPFKHNAEGDYLDVVSENCGLCHQDQHRYQKLLLEGGVVDENIPTVPGLMAAVKTNCVGCHIKTNHNNGEPVKSGDGAACAGCHTPEHPKMLKDWNDQIQREVRSVRELEQDVVQALKTAEENNMAEDKLNEARAMIKRGKEIFNIITIGNGVHNKKYSMVLIDEVYANFEDALDLLQGG